MSDNAMTVRRLYADDWRIIRDLRLRALAESPLAFGGDYARSAARTENEWRAWPGGAVFAGFHGARGVAIAAGCTPDGLDGRTELISMWVAPEARRHGLAGGLIAAVTDWARQAGADRLYLKVKPDNETAHRTYRRHGFVPDDESHDAVHRVLYVPLR